MNDLRSGTILALLLALGACDSSGDGTTERGGKTLPEDRGHELPDVEAPGFPPVYLPPIPSADSAMPPDDPPPPGAVDHYTGTHGLNSWVAGVSTDEAGNVYAIDERAAYVQRAGQTGWVRTSRGGQFDLGYPVLSVCGGAAGRVYLGFSAPEGEPEELTEEEKLQGDVDRMTLQGDGTLRLDHHYQLQNTEARWMDHTRIILSCEYVRSGPSAGDVIIGSNHGVSVLRGDDFVDHRHAVWTTPGGGIAVGYVWGVNADDQGHVLFAGHWMWAILPPVPARLGDFLAYGSYTWVHQGWAENWGGVEDPDELSSVVGDVSEGWLLVGSMGKGLAYGDFSAGRPVWRTVGNPPDTHITDLEMDGSGRIWVGTDGRGLWSLDRSTFTFERSGLVPRWAKVLDVHVDERRGRREVYAGTDSGLYVLHDP